MTRPSVLKVVVAISGGGRTLDNFLTAQQRSDARFEVIGVISSNPRSPGNQTAKSLGLPLFLGDFSAAAWNQTAKDLEAWLIILQPDRIVLAGFLKPFPVFERWARRTLNIHPALLPKHKGKGMYGLKVHAAVAGSGENVTGATVHFVNEVYDEGPIIAQVEVPLRGGESPEEIASMVFAAECDLYPKVLNGMANGELPLAQGIYRYRHEG